MWLVGLGVWFSLRVREVPGSNPGRALKFILKHFRERTIKIYQHVLSVLYVPNRSSFQNILIEYIFFKYSFCCKESLI